MYLPPQRLIRWMNAIREAKDDQMRNDLLECFWESQIMSKQWMVDELRSVSHKATRANNPLYQTAYIYGGWYGILGTMLLDALIVNQVYSIDIDPQCAVRGKLLCDDVKFITADMAEVKYLPMGLQLLINTSTEHVTQETFDKWLANMPSGIPIVLQGNNFFECSQHIRCSWTLDEFNRMNPLSRTLYSGELECPGPRGTYTRFMTIGYK